MIIRHRFTQRPIFETAVSGDDPAPLRTAVIRAVAADVSLEYADLAGANLKGARLPEGNFACADLSLADLAMADLFAAQLNGARLTAARLEGANLTEAELNYAQLERADLRTASLSGAELFEANMRMSALDDADFTRANLCGAKLDDTRLDKANLEDIRRDLWSVLEQAPFQAAGLLHALRWGTIDGSILIGGEVGTCLFREIEIVAGLQRVEMPRSLKPDPSRPAERWFLGLKEDAEPQNDPIAALTEQWIVSWMNMREWTGQPFRRPGSVVSAGTLRRAVGRPKRPRPASSEPPAAAAKADSST